MDQVAIGARIKAARERVHLTQEQLAEIIDISPTHMSVIERGVKGMRLSTFLKIANALNVSTDELFGLAEKDIDKILSDSYIKIEDADVKDEQSNKKDLEAGIAKANQILQTKSKDEIMREISKNK